MKAANRYYRGRKLRSWKPQLPDHRDFRFKMSAQEALALPPTVPSIATGSRIHDQGGTNSCTGHASTTALEVSLGLSGDAGQLSRMMAYYHARDLIGENRVDEGAYIRDVFRGFLSKGVCLETNWRFEEANLFRAPTALSLKHAAEIKQKITDAGLVYEGLKTLTEIKAAIARGQCVVFGFVVYSDLLDLTSKRYMLPMPKKDQVPLGGHAALIDGYDDRDGCVYVQNSWGRSWGLGGYFCMPYEWFTDPNYLTGDFWSCRKTK